VIARAAEESVCCARSTDVSLIPVAGTDWFMPVASADWFMPVASAGNAAVAMGTAMTAYGRR